MARTSIKATGRLGERPRAKATGRLGERPRAKATGRLGERPRARRTLLAAGAAACIVAGLPGAAGAADTAVSIRDNLFAPQEVRIDPGDTVTWTNSGVRVHDVTSDTGEFLSGDLQRGQHFSHTFEKEGYFYYHCSFHGRAGRQGMWGVVIVGDPPPPDAGGGKEERPKIEVPGDFKTIQAAVDAAEPGSTIVVGPGNYRGDVRVTTDDLIVRGTDRFRTVLDGDGERAHGIAVEGARKVTIANLTVREFTGNGVFFDGARRYTAERIDAINNHTRGVYAYRSYDGVIRASFGWGSGDSAFSVAGCMGCGALLEDLHAERSYLGYSGTNATGVTVRSSTFVRNGVGIAPNTLPAVEEAPGRGTLVVGNTVSDNDHASVPPAGIAETFGIPFGTGIWLAGVENSVVRDNVILGHARYGVLVTQTPDGSLPVNNTVVRNRVRDAAKHPLAWDGTGADNCFGNNDFTGETGPPEIETLYACANRPFAGAPYPPVQEDVAAAIAESRTRATEEPPEPRRPRCQKGRPGCHRH
ncbi:MAG: right-handed parallel beta-helix repeat-containing protein [Actinomycetota bacterium]|nr:right-handed parallel beta-helix repeat-containing protein [Actinomycetota bacterium]